MIKDLDQRLVIKKNLKFTFCPGQCGLVGWASPHKLKVCGFDSMSGHVPRLWVWSAVGPCMEGIQTMFPSLSLSLPLSEKKVRKIMIIK